MLAQVSLGTQQLALSAAECVAREPALKSAIGRYAGGIWTASECVIDPYQLCSAITNSSNHNGIDNLFNCTVKSIRVEAGNAVSLDTTRGEVQADSYVLCSGPEAALMLRPHGVYLPIYPIKGYSVTLPISDASCAPTASITDLKRKTVFARLGQRLRVAGRAELVGQNLQIEPKHINTLIAAAHALCPGACSSNLTPGDVSAWAGLRPATPSGRPIIGASPINNLLLNVGHGALGLTMAAGAAAAIAALAAGRSAPLDATPFGLGAA
jgi:D-amino-acid dehydrogenase